MLRARAIKLIHTKCGYFVAIFPTQSTEAHVAKVCNVLRLFQIIFKKEILQRNSMEVSLKPHTNTGVIKSKTKKGQVTPAYYLLSKVAWWMEGWTDGVTGITSSRCTLQ